MLDAVQQRGEPGEGVFVDHVDRLEPELPEAPVGDVADVALDLLGRHAGDRALFEGEVDEGILKPHRLLAAVDDVFLHRLGQAVAFLDEGVEQRSEEHTSELQSLMRNSYAVFCLKKKKKKQIQYACNNNDIYRN